MPIATEDLRGYLQEFNFEGLFIEGLGWDHFQARPLQIEVDETVYRLKPAAEKAGFAVYVCDPDPDGFVPSYHAQQKIEHQVAKTAFEHLIVFVDAEQSRQVWQWVKREPGKSPKPNRWEYGKGQPGDSLLQRLQTLAFGLADEAAGIGISDVTSRAGRAFDVERVTKRFYERFRTELTAFQDFIQHITDMGDRDWYASLMLNRMMFVYFIQKRGFLDGDPDYLRGRLNSLKQAGSSGKFQDFYRAFLLRLFHEGLGQPPDQRDSDLDELLGQVPFLNGGLFDVHELERDYPDIKIPDRAFERVFDFFDGYRWHLDERPHREDNEINPDVLGYIFEKYINQKQMGAYYTKEDITGYISRNTVIPFLFDEAKKKCPVAFEPDGGVWGLLRDDPDRYIYPAVAHGLTWDASNLHVPKQIDAARDLPAEITAGIDDVSKRDGWNAPAPEDVALPTETWREVVARRQRYEEVRTKLEAGDVNEINDLITLNLDIERFAIDVIAQSEGPELLRAFWQALYGKRDRSETGISVLDPTCGSGAFLFAALNILEPLYTACLEGMQGFVEDLERTERPHSPNALKDFSESLAEAKKHANPRYFILKSIVLNNLYGVDIMDEAVEICKLRLFLKLVAQLESYDQIEPLPDIDFNIRAGNTLVGFASLAAVERAMTVTPDGQHRALSDDERGALRDIREQAEIVDAAFQHFRAQQPEHGGEITVADKRELQDWLRDLADRLDSLLARQYGVESASKDDYLQWRESHQPFHWFAEFYGTMSNGGFDAIVGNPPYVQWRKIDDYSVRGYRTERCPDIYAACVERSTLIANDQSRLGMILPISFQFSTDFTLARDVVKEAASALWISTFSRNPAALFDAGLGVRSTIVVGSLGLTRPARIFTTRLNRWVEEGRAGLFASLEYAALPEPLASDGWSRSGNPRIGELYDQLLSKEHTLGSSAIKRSSPQSFSVRFKTTALYYLSVFANDPPSYDRYGTPMSQTKVGSLKFASSDQQLGTCAIALGKLALIWWAMTSDDFHVTASGLSGTPISLEALTDRTCEEIVVIMAQIQETLDDNIIYTRYAGKWMGNYDVKSVRHLTDTIDKLILRDLGLESYWEDVELEYVRFLKMTGERPGTVRVLPQFESR